MSDFCPGFVTDEEHDFHAGTFTMTICPCILPAEHAGRCIA